MGFFLSQYFVVVCPLAGLADASASPPYAIKILVSEALRYRAVLRPYATKILVSEALR